MRPLSARHPGLALAAALLGGCAAPSGGGASSPRVGGTVFAGNQGGSWEVVLPGGSTAPRLAAGPEVSRRDHTLARGPESLIEESYWPDNRHPRLDRLRRIWLTGEPEQVYYFRSGPAYPYRAYPYYRGW